MRITAMIAACALAACDTGSNNPIPEFAMPEGPIYAAGADWQLNAVPADNAISFYADDGTEASATWSAAQPTEEGFRIVAGEITMDLVRTPCTLFETPYNMTSDVRVGDRTFTGCATMRWDHELTSHLPKIDACITQSPGTRLVTYIGGGPVHYLVRLRGGDTAVDCEVDLTGNEASVTPRDESLRKASEGVVIFARGPGENPGGECYDAPEVRGANNVLLGWMLDPQGC